MALRRSIPDKTTPAAGVLHVSRDRHHATRRTTSIEQFRPGENLITWFLVHLCAGTEIGYGHTVDDQTGKPGEVFLTSSDGSWCEIGEDSGTGQVWEAGPTPLWRTVENAHDQWYALGRPGWNRFGLTVTSERQWVWLDSPEGDHTWPLPPRP